jgi:hypothetical protein
MRYEANPAFERSVRRLPADRKDRVKRAVRQLVAFFETRQQPEGLGLKRLRGDYWEVRAGLGDRIIFRLTGDLVEFLLAGNHHEIRQFLRHV